MTWVAAGVGGAAALGGGALSFFGAQSQAKSMRQAMERYLQYQENQRNIFLQANAPVQARLRSMIPGSKNYNPEADPTLKNITENYGMGLRDIQRDVLGAGVHPGGVYTPGGSDRAAMLLGQNLTASRAQMMRDTQMQNERFAIGALPTYSPGLPATPMPSSDVFTAGTPPGAGSFLGPAVSSGGQLAVSAMMPGLQAEAYGPIVKSLYASRGSVPGGSGNPIYEANYGSIPGAQNYSGKNWPSYQ